MTEIDVDDLLKRLRAATSGDSGWPRKEAADCIEAPEAVITMLESEAKFAERVVETLRTYINQQSSCNRPLHLGDLIDAVTDYDEAKP